MLARCTLSCKTIRLKGPTMREVGNSGTGRYLVKKVKAAGGMAEKVRWHRKGPPDYLVTWPGFCQTHGEMHLVETKAPGKKPRADQIRDHAKRKRYGIHVWVLDTKEKIDHYVAWCRNVL